MDDLLVCLKILQRKWLDLSSPTKLSIRPPSFRKRSKKFLFLNSLIFIIYYFLFFPLRSSPFPFRSPHQQLEVYSSFRVFAQPLSHTGTGFSSPTLSNRRPVPIITYPCSSFRFAAAFRRPEELHCFFPFPPYLTPV
ncbi:uncharacterized protein BO96DRAFT_48142 [Aspergillus niger CBS 101883]|uniref:uncharacterized protein n=1 Tax=Aspergillus lacticoffeatus (strain CBS 101883) TaxID=1450533 RepID=UPI000D80564F|nr:uncharacterized protein BO96DRAFT_48142 [Aspergillus niger CBS 101883]PYH56628.1 hypothetical protein BO96DRAFT_48142 [Aspergillus niger CBS 101883]